MIEWYPFFWQFEPESYPFSFVRGEWREWGQTQPELFRILGEMLDLEVVHQANLEKSDDFFYLAVYFSYTIYAILSLSSCQLLFSIL